MERAVDPKASAPQILQFGVFEVDLAQGELRKHGQKIKLQERPFQLLAALLERPGQVVTREELARKLWIDTLVDFDNGLNIAAKKVREALDDNAATPRYVETLPRRGYRFIAPVQPRAFLAETETREKPKPESELAIAPHEPALAPAPPLPHPTPPRRRAIYVRTIALISVLFVIVRVYWLVTSVQPARVLRVVQLTQTGRAESSDGVACDGSRVYFTERDGGRWSLAQVSVEGGNPQPVAVQIPNPDILDISPDRSSLLISGGTGIESERPLWVLPTVGGSLRRVGDVLGGAGTWSRDGSRIVFSRGAGLYQVNIDGTGSRKLLDTPGNVNSVRWAPAPDRDALRFSAADRSLKPYGLWESGTDGAGLRRLLPQWNPATLAIDGDDDGVWAATGKYFVFRSVRGRVASIWAMRENRTFPRATEGPPVQLYSTPMRFGSLAPSPDGKRIFFAAGQERRELMRYEAGHQQFAPILSDVAAGWASFSKDGQWLAYVTIPDGTLWRSRADGSDRLQLTPPTIAVQQPHWSPDGSQIVFNGTSNGQPRGVYVIASTGGAPAPVSFDAFVDGDASWSPEGNSLLFARTPVPGGSGQAGLYVMDWKTKKTTPLPGAEAFAHPDWSPDGRYIAATNRQGTEILMFDFEKRQWSPLANGEGLGMPFWSHDSKYVFYQQVLGSVEQPIFRVPIGSRKKEQLMSSKQIQQSSAAGYQLVGLAHGDAPVVTVIYDNSDIYALEVELP
jgi:Tol biopolymer transport system component/DNA-binding winged helix-turn-helix (wHTH) protein